jgi:hypothetical protein
MRNRIEILRSICFTKEDISTYADMPIDFTEIEIEFMVEFKKIYELGVKQLEKFMKKLDTEGFNLEPYDIQYYVKQLLNGPFSKYVKILGIGKKYFSTIPDSLGVLCNHEITNTNTTLYQDDEYPVNVPSDAYNKAPLMVKNIVDISNKTVEDIFRSSLHSSLIYDNTLPIVDKKSQTRYSDERTGSWQQQAHGSYNVRDSYYRKNMENVREKVVDAVKNDIGDENFRIYGDKKLYSPYDPYVNDAKTENYAFNRRLKSKSNNWNSGISIGVGGNMDFGIRSILRSTANNLNYSVSNSINSSINNAISNGIGSILNTRANSFNTITTSSNSIQVLNNQIGNNVNRIINNGISAGVNQLLNGTVGYTVSTGLNFVNNIDRIIVGAGVNAINSGVNRFINNNISTNLNSSQISNINIAINNTIRNSVGTLASVGIDRITTSFNSGFRNSDGSLNFRVNTGIQNAIRQGVSLITNSSLNGNIIFNNTNTISNNMRANNNINSRVISRINNISRPNNTSATLNSSQSNFVFESGYDYATIPEDIFGNVFEQQNGMVQINKNDKNRRYSLNNNRGRLTS